MKFITTKPMRYPESGGIEDYGYTPKGTVCETADVEGCEAILYEGKVVCDVDSGMAEEYFREVRDKYEDTHKTENKEIKKCLHGV